LQRKSWQQQDQSKFWYGTAKYHKGAPSARKPKENICKGEFGKETKLIALRRTESVLRDKEHAAKMLATTKSKHNLIQESKL
jgi:hypothetical protein